MGNDIVATDSFNAITPHEGRASISEVIEVNFGSNGIRPSDLTIVKIPSGGAKQWEVQTSSGEEYFDAIDGIIVGMRDTRAFYAKAFDGSKNPPDCSSPDAKYGEPREQTEEYGGDCALCPKAQWGSAPNGRGQACATNKLLLVLQPEKMLPVVVRCSVGSLTAIRNYLGRLTTECLPYYHVVTSLKLVKKQNADGIQYSQIEPSLIRKLEEDELAGAREYRSIIEPAFAQVSQDDVADTPF